MKAMKRIIDGIWRSGEWSEQWMTSELVLLVKVPGTHNEFTSILGLFSLCLSGPSTSGAPGPLSLDAAASPSLCPSTLTQWRSRETNIYV